MLKGTKCGYLPNSWFLPSKKLDAKFVGPFKVLKQINAMAFHLQLPPSMNVHLVFHHSLLVMVALSSPLHSRHLLPPPIVKGEKY